MTFIRKPIPLVSLMVNTENPRFEMVANQREAISMMIDEQGGKIIKLAKDIIDFGLNPTKYICVTPSTKDEKQFNVLEGNRRITTLKILNNPSIIDKKHTAFINRIKKLSETFHKNPINEVHCVVFNDSESALKWIELEHTGENEGVGVVSWNAQQKARFDKRVKGTTPLALQAIELLQRSDYTSPRIKDEIQNLTISNLERLLGDPDVRDVLGVKLQDKNLYCEIEEAEVIKGLSKIANDFLFNDFTVYDIDKKKDRKTYLESFKKIEIPNKSNRTEHPWHIVSEQPKKSELKKTKSKKSSPLSADRKNLIPRDCIMTIQDSRVNSIYRELKDIVVDDFVNATAVLLRVFFELSIDSLIAEKKGKAFQGIKKMSPLKEKTERVIKYFEDSSQLSEEELKAIKVVIQNDHSIFSIDTFNAYVHNRHILPISKDLKDTWENIQIFVEKIWENIK